MILAHVIGGKFMIIRLSTKKLGTKHIPLLSCTSPRSLLVLPDGLAEPVFRGVSLPLMVRRPCSLLATGETPYPVGHSAACK